MQIINTPYLDEARKQIQKLKKEKPKAQIIVKAKTPEFNRKVLENKNVDILLNPHLHSRKDKLKERDSGLNEILCRIAKKNNIKIGISLSEVKKAKGKDKSLLLARIKQNIKLCKRTKTDLILIGRYDKKNAFSFLLTLGASTSQAKKAIEA